MFKFVISGVVAIAGLATVATAANCSPQRGCKNCESNASMLSFSNNYCANWQNPGFSNWGWASATATGSFGSQANCFSAFDNIISQCYGHNDGGDYQYANTLTVYFCDCEIAGTLQNATTA